MQDIAVSSMKRGPNRWLSRAPDKQRSHPLWREKRQSLVRLYRNAKTGTLYSTTRVGFCFYRINAVIECTCRMPVNIFALPSPLLAAFCPEKYKQMKNETQVLSHVRRGAGVRQQSWRARCSAPRAFVCILVPGASRSRVANRTCGRGGRKRL